MENFLYKSDVDSYTQEESCTLLREEKRREERRELLLLYLLGFCFTFLWRHYPGKKTPIFVADRVAATNIFWAVVVRRP